MINKKLFTNADLNGSYQLVYTHNLNNQDVIPTLFDGASIQAITADNFALGDEVGNNKDNIVTLSLNNPITGTWKLLLSYQSGAETSAGRRAFELATGTPSDDCRVVFGKAATPSLNITFTSLYALLLSKLGFLKLSENLNDIVDKSQARTNLGVYSTTAVDNAIADKATLYQTASGAVLGVANTTIYNPTSDYHPATKRYADKGLVSGSTVIGDIDGTSNKEGDISLGVTLSNTNYRVFIEVYDPTGQPSYVTIKTKYTDRFTYHILAAFSSGTQNITLNWKVEPL